MPNVSRAAWTVIALTAACGLFMADLWGQEHAQAAETNLVTSLLSPETQIVERQSLLTFAANQIAVLNRPQSTETVSKYDKQGKLIDREVRPMEVTQSAEMSLFTENERGQILESIGETIPDSEFTNLPSEKQTRLFGAVHEFLIAFPPPVPGQLLTDSDFKALLNDLRLKLRMLKVGPVLTIYKPDVVAKQLSSIINVMTDSAIRQLDKRLQQDSALRLMIKKKLENRFREMAENTASPVFKRALPESDYENLLATLPEILKSPPKSGLPILTGSDIKELAGIKEKDVSAFLGKHGRRERISAAICMRIAVSAFLPVANAYRRYALTTGLKTDGFMDGITQGEWDSNAVAMQAVIKDEQKLQLAYQDYQIKQFTKEFERERSAMPSNASLAESPHHSRWVLGIAFLVLNAFFALLLFRTHKSKA